jgi:hypothetical protein
MTGDILAALRTETLQHGTRIRGHDPFISLGMCLDK